MGLKLRHFFSAFALAVTFALSAFAQSYPAKPIRLVVPFPPGGAADLLGRVVSQRMGESFGQQVIVENRPGANTIIGAEAVAKSAPNGYTLLEAIDSTLSMNPALYAKLPYDPLKDFEPISLIALVPNILVVGNAVPANSMQELIALAKSKPGEVMYSAGTITVHLGGELLNQMAGMRMVAVPYKGGNTAITALLTGEIHVALTAASNVVPLWKSGKLRALATMSGKRLPQFPELPTIAESGVPGYDVVIWQSIVAPAGTPREIVGKLNAELTRIMKLADTRERLNGAGLEPAYSTPEELGAFIRSESARWGKIIRDIGMKME